GRARPAAPSAAAVSWGVVGPAAGPDAVPRNVAAARAGGNGADVRCRPAAGRWVDAPWLPPRCDKSAVYTPSGRLRLCSVDAKTGYQRCQTYVSHRLASVRPNG